MLKHTHKLQKFLKLKCGWKHGNTIYETTPRDKSLSDYLALKVEALEQARKRKGGIV